MSLTKRALPEGFSVLTGEELDGEPDTNEPSASDWAISELFNAVGTLEKEGAIGYVTELKEIRARLQTVIDNTLKPF